MKYLLFSFVTLFCLPVLAYAESIASFQTDILLHFEGAERHGIFRNIPLTHPDGDSDFFHERYIEIEVESVQMDQGTVPFEISEEGREIKIKIGDADKTITGVHLYEITYTVKGALQYLPDGTVDLYWNATGNDWEVPIKEAYARVSGTEGLYGENTACYTGLQGDATACEYSTSTPSLAEFGTTDLLPGEGLTIARAVNKDAVETVVLERLNFIILVVIVLPFLAVALAVFGYRYRTKHKTGNPIIAQYEPYQSYKPMYAGMLFDGRLDPRDITAGIVYLAEQGFLKIKKTEKKVLFMFEVDDYEIELLRSSAEVESDFLRTVLELLFLFPSNVGDTLTLSSLKANTQRQTHNQKLLQQLRKDLKKDLVSSGFFQTNKAASTLLIALCVGLFLLFFVGELIYLFLGPLVLTLLIVAMVCGLLLSIFMFERRTKVGYEALDHLKGFKLFLSVTDKERMAFHNAPQKSPEQFMQYLPYAIAFGVEKQWAKVFEGITIPNPSWYDGGGASSFAALDLTSSLGAFSTSFAASSGSSASSGGGSSGGGGGGGGGGSW